MSDYQHSLIEALDALVEELRTTNQILLARFDPQPSHRARVVYKDNLPATHHEQGHDHD